MTAAASDNTSALAYRVGRLGGEGIDGGRMSLRGPQHRRAMGDHDASDPPRVVDPCGHRDHNGCDQNPPTHDVEPHRTSGQQQQENREDLKGGLELSAHRCGNHDIAGHGQAPDGHASFTHRDHYDGPPWRLGLNGEHDERSQHERLVGERVRELPEGRHHFPSPRKVPVERIGGGGNHKHRPRDPPPLALRLMVNKKARHHDGHGYQPQHRQQIWNFPHHALTIAASHRHALPTGTSTATCDTGAMSKSPRARTSARRVTGALALAVLLGAVVGAGGTALVSVGATDITPPSATITATPSVGRAVAPSPAPAPPVTFTLVAAGDVLPHGPVVSSATTAAGIDFLPLMSAVAPYIEGADLALCHMEVPVTPPGTSPSGYPMFAAPPELVTSLAAAGWDGCSTASNHSVDRRAAGITATLEAFQAAGLGTAGTARTEQEADATQMYVVHGAARDINVAHISFAYAGLNGLPKPDGQPWAVNTFDADQADAAPIIAAAQHARDEGADIVIASVHCCVEYQTAPTAAQRSVAEQVAASGLVDLYLGHHAHVPQPIEKLAGGPNGDGMWVAFGMGNFISNQGTQCCVAETTSGELITATFSIDENDRVDVGVEWTAITTDRLSGHTMHVLTDIPSGVGDLSAGEVAARLLRVANAAGPQALERTTPATPLAFGVDMIPRAG